MVNRKIETSIAVLVAIAVISMFFIFANPFEMTDTGQNPLDAALQAGAGSAAADAQMPQQLVAQDERVGTGAEAKAGDVITVNYTGRLQNGTVFDTSVGKDPFVFQLGVGQVIAGWDQGVQGMKVGGKRLLIIPASLGYGAQAVGPIPANSALIFEVELLKVESTQ